jgi:hypothetical protein
MGRFDDDGGSTDPSCIGTMLRVSTPKKPRQGKPFFNEQNNLTLCRAKNDPRPK